MHSYLQPHFIKRTWTTNQASDRRTPLINPGCTLTGIIHAAWNADAWVFPKPVKSESAMKGPTYQTHKNAPGDPPVQPRTKNHWLPPTVPYPGLTDLTVWCEQSWDLIHHHPLQNVQAATCRHTAGFSEVTIMLLPTDICDFKTAQNFNIQSLLIKTRDP